MDFISHNLEQRLKHDSAFVYQRERKQILEQFWGNPLEIPQR